MLNKLPSVKSIQLDKNIGPSQSVITTLLNYSKALEVKAVKDQKILIHLN